MMNKPKRLILKPGKEESLNRFHPWIFSGAIQKMENQPQEGDLVEVYNAEGRYMAVGHYQPDSIAVRILSFAPAVIDESFWTERIREACTFRMSIGLLNANSNVCRLVHGEGDNLPGLIIDLYGRTAVMQAHSAGMHHARKQIAVALQNVLRENIQSVYYKSENTLPFKAGLAAEDGFLTGEEAEKTAMENGLKFIIDLQKGQKTGFFIDQRDNRFLLESYSRNRTVLNLFCYTGGFSVYAMRGGAQLVHSVDSSSRAITIARSNMDMNFPDDTRHEAFAEDAFRFLANAGSTYDLIILDPPAFAKRRDVLRNALQGYRKLNATALAKIKRGGILFTFSCSQAVTRENFRLSVFSAAAQAGRRVRIIHQLSQPADHPVNIYHPEGEYLKGLVLHVE